MRQDKITPADGKCSDFFLPQSKINYFFYKKLFFHNTPLTTNALTKE
jgi:hypothetical protein